MDIYDSRYFNLNKKMLRVFGLWPYDSRKKFARTFWLVLVIILNMPQAIGLIVDMSNIDKMIEHLCIFIVLVAVLLKHYTLAIAEKKMKVVYDGIANNWLMITDEEEKKILVEYSVRGRILTIVYICPMAISVVAFLFLPLVPEILNAIDPLPTPRAHVYIFGGEFLIDKDLHFKKIYTWEAVTMLTIVAVCIAIDSMYTASVEHCCALYAIVTHRLSKLRRMGPIGIIVNHQNEMDYSYGWVVSTIKLHQIALSFTANINESYSICFLCLTVLNIVALPVICVIIMIYWNDPMSLFRYLTAFGALMLHVFVLFWPGQKLIDHSIRLLEDSTSNEWYETSARSKKILQIFMIQCTQPSLLTAGGLVVMNFKNYFTVVKTSVSYITVLASFR